MQLQQRNSNHVNPYEFSPPPLTREKALPLSFCFQLPPHPFCQEVHSMIILFDQVSPEAWPSKV